MQIHLKRTLAFLGATLGAAGLMTATAAAATAAEPRNTTPPAISGTERVGRTLTTSNGTWQNTPTSFAYQWQRCNAESASCVNIVGATKNTYTLVAADADRKLRSVVVASNADGGTTAYSAPTAVISSSSAPRNTARPSVTGTPVVGNELAATNGTWTGGVRTYAYRWQRCDAAGATCADISGATGRTYGVRTLDIGSTLRVEVTATNLAGSTAMISDRTAIVEPADTTPPPPPPPTANARPKLTLLSIRFVGKRIYARMRICDDRAKNLIIFERDSRAGQRSVTRRFSTAVPPNLCGVYTRSWAPGARFLKKGRFTATLWVRDAGGLQSNLVRRTFTRR